jgi:hypothetical protein
MKHHCQCSPSHIVIWIAIVFLVLSSILRNVSNLPSRNPDSGYRYPSTVANETKFSKPSGRTEAQSDKFRPATNLKSREQCKPDPHQPIAKMKYDGIMNHFSNTSRFWTALPGNDLPAICEFNSLAPHSSHFPHAMQQLYGCFSYWQDYPKKESVLFLPTNLPKKFKQNPFLKGFLQVLRSQLKLKIVDKESFLKENKKVSQPQVMNISGGYILQHAETLNQIVQQEFNLHDNYKSCSQGKPRISILNRYKSQGRSITNARILAASLKNFSKENNVRVQYFEEADFKEQVAFFQSTDILLATHGAQLTGLAFLDAPCSQLVEIFPKVRPVIGNSIFIVDSGIQQRFNV